MRACLELALKISREQVDEHQGRYLPMLSVTVAPGSSPGQSVTLIPSFVVFYDGPEAEGRRIAAPIFEIGAINDTTCECDYTEVTQYWKKLPKMHDHPIATAATHVSASADVGVLELAMDGFKEIVKKYGEELTGPTIGLELRSRAASTTNKVPDTAYTLRSNGMLTNLNLVHKNVKKNKEIRVAGQELMEQIRAELQRREIKEDENEDGVVALANLAAPGEKSQRLWGPKFNKLQALKKKYDPEFVFNKWFPIPPE